MEEMVPQSSLEKLKVWEGLSFYFLIFPFLSKKEGKMGKTQKLNRNNKEKKSRMKTKAIKKKN